MQDTALPPSMSGIENSAKTFVAMSRLSKVGKEIEMTDKTLNAE